MTRRTGRGVFPHSGSGATRHSQGYNAFTLKTSESEKAPGKRPWLEAHSSTCSRLLSYRQRTKERIECSGTRGGVVFSRAVATARGQRLFSLVCCALLRP